MRRAPIIVLSALALLWAAGGAMAEDNETASPEPTRRRSVEILAQIKKPNGDQSWLSHHLHRIHLNGEAGLAYTRPLSLANRDLELSLSGPALDLDSVGLAIEIRF